MTGFNRSVALSVISHGQHKLVQGLLDQLAVRQFGAVAKVVLTLNLPEPEPTPPQAGWPFELTIVHSDHPVGFAANHNRAATLADAEFFCVLNPDIRFRFEDGDPFPRLCGAAGENGAGLAYPMQVSPQGGAMDHERAYPTPWTLFKRHLLKTPETRMDWVNGACMVMRRTLYVSLGGFDEGFRMYCEDVEWCLRLRAAGYRLAAVPVTVVHASQRQSRRSLRHMIWHLHSLFRLWASPRFWRAVHSSQRPDAGFGVE